jgi:hypothetical protein
MLWYKGWLETRFRLAFSIAFIGFLLVTAHLAGTKPPPPGAKPVEGLVLMAQSMVVVFYSMLAGAGINTQPAFQAVKGLHGSTMFTLSLPVSRLRLLAVRSSIGWLATLGVIATLCVAMWFVLLRINAVTKTEMIEYAATLMACSSAFYFLSVLLGVFLDDAWRVWASMLCYGAFWLLTTFIPMRPSLNLIRAMGEGSPLIAHTVPWGAMAFSVALAGGLFFAAWKIAERREY